MTAPQIVVQKRANTTHRWVVHGRCDDCRKWKRTAECAQAAQLSVHRNDAAAHVRLTGHRVRLHIIEVAVYSVDDGTR